MPETTAPIPVVQEPTKLPPPDPVTASIPVGGETKKTEDVPAWTPKEYELEVKGQKRKLKIDSEDQLRAHLQKSAYADEQIKTIAQKEKAIESFINILKTGTMDELEGVFNDPMIGRNFKDLALEKIKYLMAEEEKYKGWTEDQIKAAERAKLADKYEAEQKRREEQEKQRIDKETREKNAAEMRGALIAAIDKYPDIPKTQETFDAVILKMRAGFNRFQKWMTPDQAMSLYAKDYWAGIGTTLDKMTPQQILEKFGQKTLDKIQQFKLNELKEKTDPSKQKQPIDGEIRKKKSLSEKDFDKHFSKNILPLAGL